MIGIYKIINPTDKIYIGQSINIEKRINQYKKLRCKQQVVLYRSLLKYGYDNHKFEIIEECCIDLLNTRERYWQDYYNCIEKGLNCKLTKTDDKCGILSIETKNKIREKAIGRKISDETKMKMSISRKNRESPMLGKKHSFESKNKISKSNLGRMCSDYTRNKLSEANKGKIGSMLGKKHSEESKLKMSKSLLGNKRNLNNKMSEKHKEILKMCFSKVILDTQTGIFYYGTKEASFYNNLNQSTLKSKLNGGLKNNTNLIYC